MVKIYLHNSIYDQYVILGVQDDTPILSDTVLGRLELKRELEKLVEEYNNKGLAVKVIGDVDFLP